MQNAHAACSVRISSFIIMWMQQEIHNSSVLQTYISNTLTHLVLSMKWYLAASSFSFNCEGINTDMSLLHFTIACSVGNGFLVYPKHNTSFLFHSQALLGSSTKLHLYTQLTSTSKFQLSVLSFADNAPREASLHAANPAGYHQLDWARACTGLWVVRPLTDACGQGRYYSDANLLLLFFLGKQLSFTQLLVFLQPIPSSASGGNVSISNE